MLSKYNLKMYYNLDIKRLKISIKDQTKVTRWTRNETQGDKIAVEKLIIVYPSFLNNCLRPLKMSKALKPNKNFQAASKRNSCQ